MPRTKPKATKQDTPADNAIVRRVIPAQSRKGNPLTLRVAAYPADDTQGQGQGQGGKQMTFGIGDSDPTSFAKISAILTPQNITEIIKALNEVKKATPSNPY